MSYDYSEVIKLQKQIIREERERLGLLQDCYNQVPIVFLFIFSTVE